MKILLKLSLALPKNVRLRDGEPSPAGVEVGYFMELHSLSGRESRRRLKCFARCADLEIAL